MLKPFILNLGFSGSAQAVTLLTTLVLAHYMGERNFANLAIVLSAATLLSVFLTLQIERVYVRVPSSSIDSFVATHLISISLLSICTGPLILLVPRGTDVLFLAWSIAVNQSVSYHFARLGHLHKTWLIRWFQAGVLAVGSLLVIWTSSFGLAAIIYALAWLLPSVVLLDRGVSSSILRQRRSEMVKSLREAFKVCRVALLSVTLFNIVREGPVLIAGALHSPSIAAALGLCNRVVAQPLGLVGRSVSMVLASAVVAGTVSSKVSKILLMLTVFSTLYCAAIAFAASKIPALSPFTALPAVALAMTPLYVGHLAVGALGPYFMAENLHYREMWMFLAQAGVSLALGGYLWIFGGTILGALWLLSIAVALTTGWFVVWVLRASKSSPWTS